MNMENPGSTTKFKIKLLKLTIWPSTQQVDADWIRSKSRLIPSRCIDPYKPSRRRKLMLETKPQKRCFTLIVNTTVPSSENIQTLEK
ncbi:hypothetical protein EUTSA_v10010865mg [Eutrema salsugineum]|uniref:Uncharacterized protein n=1 Tax=Eutrema salsugineum TaxID=72664 RepID=V4L4X9_EUTSA|nr:hypothetical protein EUTSA_v10010865mg [Eutrema salsugineum]